MPSDRQLLAVWNPFYSPDTIQTHARVLQQQRGSRGRKVWWGKMYSGLGRHSAELRKQWKYLLDHEKSCRKRGLNMLLFVTDFATIHALRCDHIHVGDLGASERKWAPEYYFDNEDRQIALWFQVRDLRIVASSQMDSLAYFREDLGRVLGPAKPEFSDFYSPYASQATPYPIVLEGPSVSEVFNYSGDGPKLDMGQLYADDEAHILASPMRAALVALQEEYPAVWEALSDKSRLYLASAWVMAGQDRADPRFDYAGALACMAKALETELVEAIMSPVFDRMTPELRTAVGSDWKERGTLKGILHCLKTLFGETSGNDREAMAPLIENRAWWEWVESFAGLRGKAVHRAAVEEHEFDAAWKQLFSQSLGFGPLAKVHGLLAQV